MVEYLTPEQKAKLGKQGDIKGLDGSGTYKIDFQDPNKEIIKGTVDSKTLKFVPEDRIKRGVSREVIGIKSLPTEQYKSVEAIKNEIEQERNVKQGTQELARAKQQVNQARSDINDLTQSLLRQDRNYRTNLKIGNNTLVGITRDDALKQLREEKRKLSQIDLNIKQGYSQLEKAKTNLNFIRSNKLIPSSVVNQITGNTPITQKEIRVLTTGNMANMSSFDKFVNNLNKNPDTRTLAAFIQGIFKTSVAPPTEEAQGLKEIAAQTLRNLKTNWKYAKPDERLAFLLRESAEWVTFNKLISGAAKIAKELIREVPKFVGKTVSIATKGKGITTSITRGNVKALLGRTLPQSKKLKVWIDFLARSEFELINKELKLSRSQGQVVGIVYKPIGKAVKITRSGLKKTYKVNAQAITSKGEFLSKALTKKVQTFAGQTFTRTPKDELINVVKGVSLTQGKVSNKVANNILSKLGFSRKASSAIIGTTFTQVDDLALALRAGSSKLPYKIENALKKTKLYNKVNKLPSKLSLAQIRKLRKLAKLTNSQSVKDRIHRILIKPLATIQTRDLVILLAEESKGASKVMKKLATKNVKSLTKTELKTLGKAMTSLQVREKQLSIKAIEKTAKRLQTALQTSKVLQKSVVNKVSKEKRGVKSVSAQNGKVALQKLPIYRLQALKQASTLSVRKSRNRQRVKTRAKNNVIQKITEIQRPITIKKTKTRTITSTKPQSKKGIVSIQLPIIPVIPVRTIPISPTRIKFSKKPNKTRKKKKRTNKKSKEEIMLTRSLSTAFKKKFKPIKIKPYYTGLETR